MSEPKKYFFAVAVVVGTSEKMCKYIYKRSPIKFIRQTLRIPKEIAYKITQKFDFLFIFTIFSLYLHYGNFKVWLEK